LTSRISALIVFVAVLAVSGMSLLWQISSGVSAPTTEDWERAGAWLGPRLEPNDAIRFLPVWFAQSETLLTALDGGLVPFVDRAKTPSAMLGTRFSRLWVVSTLGHPLQPAPAGATEVERFELDGDIQIRLYRLDTDRLVYPLVQRLDDAEVSRRRTPTGRYSKCRRKGDKHNCQGNSWENVEADWYQVGGAPRECFILHPYPDHGSVKIRWPRVPIDSILLLRSGFTIEAARNENGADCQVVVQINGETVDEWVEPKNGWHFDERRIDTSRWKGKEAELVIEVTSPDEDFRDLCFDGAVLTTTD
jgi:hypothetical protein